MVLVGNENDKNAGCVGGIGVGKVFRQSSDISPTKVAGGNGGTEQWWGGHHQRLRQSHPLIVLVTEHGPWQPADPTHTCTVFRISLISTLFFDRLFISHFRFDDLAFHVIALHFWDACTIIWFYFVSYDWFYSFLFIYTCHGPCSITFFLKNNQRTAPTEPPMMAASPLFSATITTSHLCQTYIRALSEYLLYSDTTNKPTFLSLPLPTSTMCHLLQHNQSPTMLHTCSMSQANHIACTPVLEVMGLSRHKDLWGFESASFGTIQSMSIFVICSILQPYALLTISLYVYICLCINTPVCCMYFTSSNINLATYFSQLALVCLKLLLCSTPDLRNLRHPSRERHNPQVEANTSHDFGPDISVWILSLTVYSYDPSKPPSISFPPPPDGWPLLLPF